MNETENVRREVEINAMKDDGATYTTVSEELVHGLKAVRLPLPKKISLGGFNSAQEWATEFTLLELDIEGFDEFDNPVIATIIIRAIIAPTLQGSLLLGGNLIKKHRICIDPDTAIITMFRGRNLFRTNCVPWSLVQSELQDTVQNVKALVESLQIHSTSDNAQQNTPSPMSLISTKTMSISNSMFPTDSDLPDSKEFSKIQSGCLEAISPVCHKYTEFFDKSHGIFGSILSEQDLSVYRAGEISF
jgi:hypothetical protein